MRSGLKTVGILFLVVLAVYLMGFYGIEHLRHCKGAWRVTFVADATGRPSIEINHLALNITSVTVWFHGQQVTTSNVSETVAFDMPQKPVPFGKVLFEDLTFLPGAVAFNFFGHEVELLPRTLLIDRQPVQWDSQILIELEATNTLATPTRSPPRTAPP